MTVPASRPLRRLLGTPTALLLGMGVAIGSGIFRTPGEVAAAVPATGWILLAWVLGGVVVLLQGLVTAELATRFPRAGGEYVFLREAYGDFVAFFFGWAYTVFIIGGGAAAIALAFGDFGRELWRLPPVWSGYLAVAALAGVTAVNAAGLKTGAVAQNLLTGAKIAALLGIVLIGLEHTGTEAAVGAARGSFEKMPGLAAILTAALPVMWTYNGTTDAVKLAEEIRDVRRALPIAVIGSTLALIALYVLVNVALLRVVPPAEMAGLSSVPGEAMLRLFGENGRRIMLIVAMLVCLGSLSSTVLATIRVTFAQARDGLTFRFLGRMSEGQAPVPALVTVGGFSTVLVLNRNFTEALEIYYLASAVLFGLAYGSLIIFRLRDRREAEDYFRCPMGRLMALAVIAIQVALAVNIVRHNPRDALYTALLLAVCGAMYPFWRKRPPKKSGPEHAG